MAKILNAEEGTHIVKEYAFRNLDITGNVEETETKPTIIKAKNDNINQDDVEKNSTIKDTHFEMIEQLLQKSDLFSSSVQRLEKQLQEQMQECDKKIAETKETNYKLGYNEGYNKAKTELEDKIKEHLSKLIESVHKIEEVYKDYQSKAENIEKELVGVAVDIAEEVIAKELSKHSKEIALSLTKELLNDIKEATQVEIKLNPLDYDYVKENLNLEKVKVTPDNAINLGGVVILSDAGNIEAEIHKRFEAIKNHILKG